jgi:predicted outer membrane protein
MWIERRHRREDPVSEALREEADDEVAKIDDLGGISFDRSYLKRVIEYHRAFLDTLERDLIPQVRSEELDALLGEVQAEFAAHLAEAEALAATLWNWTRSADICGNRRARPRLRP